MQIINGFDLPVDQAFDLICGIYRACDAFAATLKEIYPEPETFARYLRELKQRPGAQFLVAQQDDVLTGFLFADPRPYQRMSHVADLRIGTLSSSIEHGIEPMLLSDALSRAWQEGQLEILYLTVRTDDTSRIHHYEKAGFTRTAVLKKDLKIDGEYFDGFLMSVDLVQLSQKRSFASSLQMGNRATLHPTSP